MNTFLFCDVGNTAIDILLETENRQKWSQFYPKEERRMLDFLSECPKNCLAFISSVSNPNFEKLSQLLKVKKIPFQLLDSQTMCQAAMRLGYQIDNIDILGQDLFCDIVGAGPESLIVDFGTATKILAVDDRARFLGGAILPGIPSFPKTLFHQTDLIPEFSLLPLPLPLLSMNTDEAISSGAINGTAFLIDGFLKKAKDLYGLDKCRVLFTGGNYPYVQPLLDEEGEYRRDLVLQGLRRIFLS